MTRVISTCPPTCYTPCSPKLLASSHARNSLLQKVQTLYKLLLRRFCAPTICTPSMTAMLLKERSSQVRFVRLSRFSIFSIMLLSSCRRRRPTQWLGSHPHQYQTVAQTRAHCYLLSKLATCLVSKYALLFSCRDQVEMSTSGHTAFRKRPAMLRLYIDIHRFPSRADGTGRKTL